VGFVYARSALPWHLKTFTIRSETCPSQGGHSIRLRQVCQGAKGLVADAARVVAKDPGV